MIKLEIKQNVLDKTQEFSLSEITKLIRLEDLTIQGMYIQRLNSESFKNSFLLRNLELTNCDIENIIGNSIFKNNINLFIINLSNNKIGSIDQYAFQESTVIYLNLGKNRLTQLFIIPSNLVNIELNNNQFTLINKIRY